MKKLFAAIVIALGLTGTVSVAPAQAQQEGFLGEMKFFAGNFAPRGWAFCDGQLLPISQHSALFSILGTIYGGDGRTTFALPDMRSRGAFHAGRGPGLSERRLGARFGSETNVLSQSNMPSHNHSVKFQVSSDAPDSAAASNGIFASGTFFSTFGTANTPVSNTNITQNNVGSSQSFSTMSPGLAVNCIIALTGIFPSRS